MKFIALHKSTIKGKNLLFQNEALQSRGLLHWILWRIAQLSFMTTIKAGVFTDIEDRQLYNSINCLLHDVNYKNIG